jgi:hypothetical protein
MIWSKPELAEMLRSSVLEVSFTKKDGSGRVMNCTLQEKYLPPLMEDTEVATKDNPNVLAVWDIDNSGWRSFRINSIVDVRIVND